MSSFSGPGRPLLLLCAGVGIAACAGGVAPGLTGRPHMAEHYGQVQEIKEALIAGDVNATRAPARWLSTHPGDEYPPAAAPALEAMREAARTMLQQRDILPVSRSLGRMGVACGDCHAALDLRLAFQIDEPRLDSPTPTAQMARHGWAVDRLWDGLAGPSEEAWRAGAAALSTFPSTFGSNPQAHRLAARVIELAAEAAAPSTPQQRAHTFGDLLETCALCHTSLRPGGS